MEGGIVDMCVILLLVLPLPTGVMNLCCCYIIHVHCTECTEQDYKLRLHQPIRINEFFYLLYNFYVDTETWFVLMELSVWEGVMCVYL